MNQPYKDDMPMLGLGTWENTESNTCRNSVKKALEIGYRHVDTAQIYGNESEVGDGIEMSDIPREQVFLATKIWIDSLSYNDVISSFNESLDRLGVDYVDLLYIHWPSRTYDARETLDAFNELYEEGLIHRLGISNFEPKQVRDAVEYSNAPIFANQIEIHPMLSQNELIETCREENVNLVAYSPLARGRVFSNDIISSIADDYEVSEARVSLAWLRHKGITAIPKASSQKHILDNWKSLDLELKSQDIKSIDNISIKDRRVDPSFAPW